MTKISRITMLTVLMAIFMQLPLFSLAQISNEKLINLLSTAVSGFNEVQTKKLSHIKQNKLHKSVQFIKIGEFSKIVRANKGSLPIQIPGIRKTYMAKPVKIEYYSDLNYKWVGKINKDDGEVIIICKDGETFGYISIDDKTFEIQSFDKDKNILIEFDNDEVAKQKCGFDHSDTTIQAENKKSQKSSLLTITRPDIRVLVLFTPNANIAVSDIYTTASLAISQMNETFSNSLIDSDASVSLAGVVPFDFTENANSIQTDVNSLIANVNAQNLRNTYQADLVVLLTDGNYGNNQIYGIVGAIGPSNENGYAIVEADMATGGRYTFTHEVGHLFGGRHEDNIVSGTDQYDHGYHFLTGIWPFRTDRYTIMHTLSSGSRIMYYSNPDVEYKGEATGTTDFSNVARRIRETAPTVEAFRDYIPPLSVYISGPTRGYNNGTYTWTSHVSSGIPPYTYQWDYSYNGIDYIGSLGDTPSITNSLPIDYDLYLRLSVTSSNGEQAVDFHTTINLGDDPHQLMATTSAKPDSIITDSSLKNKITEETITNKSKINLIDWTIYPNPVSENTTIAFAVNQKNMVIIDVLDLQGIKVRNITSQEYNKGFYSINFSLSGMLPGTYICRIRQNDQISSKKVVIK